MDKNKLLDRFASSDDQRILLSHIYDLMTRSNDRNILTASRFFGEADAAAVEGFCRASGTADFFLYGGYSEAERKCVIFLPEYYTVDDVIAMPSLCEITYIKASVSKFDAQNADISHRDVLGSLMGLGIERSAVGDIIAEGSSAVFIIKSSLCEFIKENLSKISRYNVDVNVFDEYIIKARQDYVEDSDTVASMRLDAVVSSVFGISRTSAYEYITASLVSINGVTVAKPDCSVNVGDKLTLRGKGKAQILKLDGFSKKGRIRFHYRIYK